MFYLLMRPYYFLFGMLFFLGLQNSFGQISQDCIDAIPICNNTPVNGGTDGFGIDDFNGLDMSGCLEKTLGGTIESNAAWYRFRTAASGQLGFNIGINASEDWDFALYKTSDCSSLGDPIRCNFFDNQDQSTFVGVGEDPTGDLANIQFEEWLEVTPGEDYYLLINNFSNSNSGFSIQFSGNIFVTNPYDALDCSIISNLLGPPISACEYDNVTLDATTVDALDYKWFSDTGSGFQEIVGENNPTYVVSASAIYQVVVARAAGNIISEVQVGFSTVPTAYPLADEASCSGMTSYDLSLKDSEVLGSQNPSEFVVSYYSSLGDAITNVNSLPRQFPLQSGSQTIYVRVASSENPNCFDAPQQFELINLKTPELDFPSEAYLCNDNSSVSIGAASTNANYTYLWDSGETTPNIIVSQTGTHTLTLTNTQNGLSCLDSKTITVVASTLPSITNVEIQDLQNDNTVTVETDIAGDWLYQLDSEEPQSSNLFSSVLPGEHVVSVIDPRGCGSVSEEIIVVGFPKFFTPNGDGMHDNWSIDGIDNLTNPVVLIYNRYGKLLKQLNLSDFGWDGMFNGQQMPSSDYWFKLTYTDTNGQTTTAKYINNHFSLRR